MSWGVATQNGVSVSLASIVSLSAGVTEFSPIDLFTGGTVGAWYDPSDYSTLFQDSAGTTPVTAVEQPVGLMRDKSGNGNHASQATSTSRPVLRARYNLLTYSEQFNNAAWVGQGATVSPNVITAPDGTTTADAIIEDGTTGIHRIYQGVTTTGAPTFSVYAKAGTRSWLQLQDISGLKRAWFDLANGVLGTVNAGVTASITAVPGYAGWYRCVASINTTSTLYLIEAAAADGGTTYTGVNGNTALYIWGADLRTGSSAGTYQRIAAATDYETAGFLPYLAFDGVDDRMTATVTSADYINNTVAFGVAFNAAQAVIGNIGNSASFNSFSYISGQSGTNDWVMTCRNDAGTNFGTYPPGCVVGTQYVVISRFSTSASATRVNATTATGSANSGVITANIFNIGSLGRTTPSGFANQRLYSALFFRESLSTANEAQLATWMATKTGVTL